VVSAMGTAIDFRGIRAIAEFATASEEWVELKKRIEGNEVGAKWKQLSDCLGCELPLLQPNGLWFGTVLTVAYAGMFFASAIVAGGLAE